MIKAGQRPLIFKLDQVTQAGCSENIVWYAFERAIRATARQDHRSDKENDFQMSYLCLELIF